MKRIVVKIGSSSLTRDDGGLDLNRIDRVAAVVAEIRRQKVQVVLVSSGAIAAGLLPLQMAERPNDLATAQAVASVGQGLLMYRWTQAFALHGVTAGQVLLSAPDLINRGQYANANRALEKLLALGVVPVVNENDAVATDEIRFGDNDRLAALVSHLVKADLLVLCTDVDGLYTAPPTHPGSRMITEVSGPQDLEGIDILSPGSRLGTGGMVTKVSAAQMAAANGTEVRLTSADLMEPALRGQAVGTLFKVTGRRREVRRLWLAYAASAIGTLVLDSGAVKAVTVGKKSLLAAGITAVEGEFESGAVVEMRAESGEVVARGFTSYSAQEIKELVALHKAGVSEQVNSHLAGGTEQRPVIHRDNLAETRY